MKKSILFFFLVLFHTIVLSQTTIPHGGGFQFDTSERKVTWVKIFDIDPHLKLKDLKKYFIENNIVEFQSEDSLSMVGVFKKRSMDIQKYGYKRANTPMILLDNEQVSNVIMEYKEGRYRVILTDVGYIDKGVISDIFVKGIISPNAATSKGNFVSYGGEVTFNKKNEVRTSYSMVYEILDKFYSDMFSYKKPMNKGDDW